jgi:phosphoribosylformylglycinamidine synthase
MAATDSDIDDTVLLFAESNSRIVLEVEPEDEARVRAMFRGVPIFEIGEVTKEPMLMVEGLQGTVPIDIAVSDLVNTWREPIYQIMGETAP